MSSSEKGELLPDNPVHLKSLVGKTITIKTVGDMVHKGVVYVIDPLHKTVVLLTENHMTIVPYHGMETLEVADEAVDATVASFPETTLCDTAADMARKDRLKRWLEHMHINVEECEDCLKVGEHVTITAPYNKDSCSCANTVILEKFRNIIDYMPESFT